MLIFSEHIVFNMSVKMSQQIVQFRGIDKSTCGNPDVNICQTKTLTNENKLSPSVKVLSLIFPLVFYWLFFVSYHA